ncbi:TPA: DotU family type IV/VI secretion system protein [Escherichia coli]|nr:DotU family type IV/VI secretion system protein [Escherichia coli]
MEIAVNLLECYMPVFTLITEICAEPEKFNDYEITRSSIIKNIEQAVQDSERILLSDNECDAAFYAMVVMVDETILCSKLPFCKTWRDNLLQMKYFGHSTGGVEFFHILDNIIGTKNNAIWIFFFCLSLGFRGKYSVNNGDDIDGYISRLRSQCNPDCYEVLSIEKKYNKKYKPLLIYSLSVASIVVAYIAMFLFLLSR